MKLSDIYAADIYAAKNIWNTAIDLITLILMVCCAIRKQTDSSWTNDFKDIMAITENKKHGHGFLN